MTKLSIGQELYINYPNGEPSMVIDSAGNVTLLNVPRVHRMDEQELDAMNDWKFIAYRSLRYPVNPVRKLSDCLVSVDLTGHIQYGTPKMTDQWYSFQVPQAITEWKPTDVNILWVNQAHILTWGTLQAPLPQNTEAIVLVQEYNTRKEPRMFIVTIGRANYRVFAQDAIAAAKHLEQ